MRIMIEGDKGGKLELMWGVTGGQRCGASGSRLPARVTWLGSHTRAMMSVPPEPPFLGARCLVDLITQFLRNMQVSS